MKALHIREFPEELKNDLRVLALKEGSYFYELVIRVLTEYVDKAEKS